MIYNILAIFLLPFSTFLFNDFLLYELINLKPVFLIFLLIRVAGAR